MPLVARIWAGSGTPLRHSTPSSKRTTCASKGSKTDGFNKQCAIANSTLDSPASFATGFAT
eukprot:6389278-Alexandrium_andersonii.AAC.1